MKKLIILVVLLASVVLYAGCSSSEKDTFFQPDDHADIDSYTTPDIEIEIKDIKPFKYVCIEETGSFDKMEESIGTLWMEAGKQGLQPAGAMFGIYYNDPGNTPEAEWKWEVGFKVAGDVKVQEPLKLKEWTHTKVATYVAYGPYEETEGKYYPALYAKAANMGYVPGGPSMSIYHNDPNTVKPEEIKTELVIPVEKFESDSHPMAR